MAHITYGSERIEITESADLKNFTQGVLNILSSGGGWMTFNGTNDDTGEAQVRGFLVTPGVPISFEADGTVEGLGLEFDFVQQSG